MSAIIDENLRPEYVPGKQLVVADTLSRQNKLTRIDKNQEKEGLEEMEEDISCYVHKIINQWSASDDIMDRIRRATRNDPILNQALSYTLMGWPKYKDKVSDGLEEL